MKLTKEQALNNIKELETYIEGLDKVKKRTWCRGDVIEFYFLGKRGQYIISAIAYGSIILIDLSNGNWWSNSVKVSDSKAITEEEMAVLMCLLHENLSIDDAKIISHGMPLLQEHASEISCDPIEKVSDEGKTIQDMMDLGKLKEGNIVVAGTYRFMVLQPSKHMTGIITISGYGLMHFNGSFSTLISCVTELVPDVVHNNMMEYTKSIVEMQLNP